MSFALVAFIVASLASLITVIAVLVSVVFRARIDIRLAQYVFNTVEVRRLIPLISRVLERVDREGTTAGDKAQIPPDDFIEYFRQTLSSESMTILPPADLRQLDVPDNGQSQEVEREHPKRVAADPSLDWSDSPDASHIRSYFNGFAYTFSFGRMPMGTEYQERTISRTFYEARSDIRDAFHIASGLDGPVEKQAMALRNKLKPPSRRRDPSKGRAHARRSPRRAKKKSD